MPNLADTLIHSASFTRFHADKPEVWPYVGCFHCGATLASSEVTEFPGKGGTHALCPKCGIDALLPIQEKHLGEAPELLAEQRKVWFDSTYATNPTLKERVKHPATFAFFRDGDLWYKTYDGWTFPVPVSDTENAQGGAPTFNAIEKGITMMRWIRKAMNREQSA